VSESAYSVCCNFSARCSSCLFLYE